VTKVKEAIRTPRPARTRKRSKGQQVGYLRVSSLDQNEVRQLEGLALNKTFTDKASGKDVKRPQLEAMQSFVREGDTVTQCFVTRCYSQALDAGGLARCYINEQRTIVFHTQSGSVRSTNVTGCLPFKINSGS
jgi:Resolvase, N terminal domain